MYGWPMTGLNTSSRVPEIEHQVFLDLGMKVGIVGQLERNLRTLLQGRRRPDGVPKTAVEHLDTVGRIGSLHIGIAQRRAIHVQPGEIRHSSSRLSSP